MGECNMKRFADIILSLCALIILLPFFIPIMIILKLTGEHYIFYGQKRIGKGGTPFNLLKFSTMLKDSPNLGSGFITLENDPRVFPFGKLLRKTKINELPQLFNILRGDISIVGPRPTVKEHFEKLPEEAVKAIKNTTPGITGIGSLFFRDEESLISLYGKDDPQFFFDNEIQPYKGQLELWYSENKSFSLDLKIILLTAYAIFFPKNKNLIKNFKKAPELPEFMKSYYD
jgi:lipopolysaccharide/colanic/teichoic acid biosynthesis glycosyltransferase